MRTKDGMDGGRGVTWGLLLAFVLIPALAPQVWAQSDRRLHWRSIEAGRFRVHYHEPLGLLARELATEAEEINGRIERALGLSLQQRVEIVLADESDSANGFASPLPYNAMRLRAAAPDDMSPLADYDHWPRLLFTHEHTHILQLEHAGGLPRFLQRLFGRFYTPQGSLPGWFVEGLAVVEESAHTSAGRARSTLFDMYLRMDALEGRILGLDWMGFEGEPWPHGNVRYLYGQAFVGFVARRHGEAALGRFVREYGKRLVPFGLNRALKRATGETFTALYRAFTAELRERAAEVAARVASEGLIEGVRLTHHGELTRSPRFVSSHELAYLVSDARHVPELRRLDLAAPARPQRVRRLGSVGQLASIDGAGRVIYSQVDYHRGVYPFSELFAVDLDGGRPQQLTRGLRAREQDVSPDGKRIAYVTQSAGTSHLELAELADIAHTRRLVVQSRRLDQVFTPRWSPDGRHLAYSAFQRGGYRDLWLLDVATGARTRITYDRAIDRAPVFARDGSTLYFSSDRSGIANIYAYDLGTGTLSQITNVVGGAFQPDISPDGETLAYVGYTSRGFDLYALDLRNVKSRSVGPAAAVWQREPPRALPDPAALVSTSYRPGQTVWPRYYELSREEADSGTRLVLSTHGADAVGLHSWSLRAFTNLNEREHALELGYAYRQVRMPVLLYGDLRERKRTDLIVSRRGQPWLAREGSLGLATAISFPAPLRSLSLRADYVASVLYKARPFDVPLDPNYPAPRLPPLGIDTATHWSVTYATAQRMPFDISTSWGHVLTVSGTLREPYLGSRERSYGINYRAEQFLRFDVRDSVLALAFTGAHRSWSALGGFPAQLVPLRDALLGTRGPPADYARLRGFRTRYGEELAVAQVEYRLLVSRINRGIETLPLFARRVHAALFLDAGDAWSGAFDPARLGVGVGAELRLDWASDYGSDYTLRGGLARGLTRGGELQWYTTLATPF